MSETTKEIETKTEGMTTGRMNLNVDTSSWAKPDSAIEELKVVDPPADEKKEVVDEKTVVVEEPKVIQGESEPSNVIEDERVKSLLSIIGEEVEPESINTKEAKPARESELAQKESPKKETDVYKAKLMEAIGNGDYEAAESILSSYKPVNWGAKSPQEVYAHFLKSQGVEGDDFDIDMEGFNSKLKGEQLAIIAPIKEELNKSEQNRVSSMNKPTEEDVRFERIRTTGLSKIDEVVSKMSGSEYMLTQITPEMADKIRQCMLNDENPPAKYDASGSLVAFDIPELAKKHFLLNYYKQYTKAVAETSKSEGMREFHQKRVRVSTNETSGAAPLSVKDVNDAIKSTTESTWGSGSRKVR